MKYSLPRISKIVSESIRIAESLFKKYTKGTRIIEKKEEKPDSKKKTNGY